jgi:hypothetical protein
VHYQLNRHEPGDDGDDKPRDGNSK